MKHSQFSKKRLAVYISAILASGMGTQVFAEEATTPEQVSKAQDTAAPEQVKAVTAPEQVSNAQLDASKEDDVEVIEVTGIRGSLVRSMNIKRNMSGVVDAISSEEMGKFPDTNLAEALQRITGVTVSRTNGEGSQITVRGFGPDFNLVTLNGRQMPGTGNSRSYDFSNLASDGVQELVVHKTARATNPTGGLGATVNIVTGKPLSSPGQKLSVSAKAIHDTSNVTGSDVTPELSALYSNTFADETFGFGFNVSHQERDFQQQNATIQGWQAQLNDDLPSNLDPSMITDNRDVDADGNHVANAFDEEGNPLGVSFFPRNMAYNVNNVERERTNAHAIVQYAPIDELVVSLDWTGGKSLTGENSLGWGMWNEYGGNINGYEFDNNGTALYADITGSDGSYTATRVTTEVIEQSVGLNIDWQVSDNFSLAVDYHNSSIETDDGADSGLGSKGALVVGSNDLETKIYDYRTGDIPNAEILWNNGTSELAPSEVDSHFSQFTHTPGKSEVEQLQIDSVWTIDAYDIGLMEIRFGLARTEQTMSGSNAWSGLTGGFGFSPDYTAILPDSMFTRNDTSDFLNAFDGGGNDLNTNYYYTFDFDQLAAISEQFLTNEELGGSDYFALGAYRDGGTESESSVTEETSSIYLDSLWEFDLGSFPVQINAGFRYEQTDVSSQVLQPIPTDVWWQGGSEWHTQYVPGENTYSEFEGEHDVFLPMLDVKVDLSDELIARASFSKTIARPDLGSLAGGLTLSGSPKIGSRTGSSGNTNLQPYESVNIDLGLTYYYADGSYASVGYFNKDVKNFITDVATEKTFDGFYDIWQGPRWNQAVSDLEANGEQVTTDTIFAQIQANGSTLNSDDYLTPTSADPLMVWNITAPENVSDTKNVYGIELALQHLIGETGFGFGINGTLVEGDVEFDVNDFYAEQTPLTGLSDSANAQVFYEKNGLSVKFTYAWRDTYYSGQGQDGGSVDNPPNFTKEYAQLDMSVNYDISDNFTVFFEGINLTNATEEGYGRYEEQFMFAREYGQRYALGMRYSFQ